MIIVGINVVMSRNKSDAFLPQLLYKKVGSSFLQFVYWPPLDVQLYLHPTIWSRDIR